MLTCDPVGSIGNIMFQLAAMEYMGKRSGISVCYPNIDNIIQILSRASLWTTNAHDYFLMFKNFDWHKNTDKFIKDEYIFNVPFGYMEIQPKDNTHYVGYFQSERYFPDREFVLSLFEPSEYITDKLMKYDDMGRGRASIHVRRGNYLSYPHIYEILGMGYYKKAMNILADKGISEYLVFSNDMEWCRANFIGEQFIFIEDENIVELYLMGMCSHSIITNSSFSWWGAYLNKNPDKVVIAPERWFSTPAIDSSDIVSPKWIKIWE